MKKNYLHSGYLFIFTLMVSFVFAACSSSDDVAEAITSVIETSGEQNDADTEGITVTTSSSDRITNFHADATTRAAEAAPEALTMPEAPSVPADAIVIENTDYPNWMLESGKTYVVNGTLSDMQLQLTDCTIYFTETANVSLGNFWSAGGTCTIYILPGATVVDNLGSSIANLTNVNVYNYSENYTFTKSTMYVQSSSKFYTAVDLNYVSYLENQGEMYVGGNLAVDNFTTAANAVSTVIGTTTTTETLKFCHNSQEYFAGAVNTKYVDVNGAANVYVGCSMTVETDLAISNDIDFWFDGGELSCANLSISSGRVMLSAGSLIQVAGQLYVNNPSDYTYIKLLGGEDTYAVANCNHFAINQTYDLLNVFVFPNGGVIGLNYNQVGYNGGSQFDAWNMERYEETLVALPANVKVNNDTYANVAKSDCVPDGVDTPEPIDPYIDHVSTIDPVEGHDHLYSSTGIALGNNRTYVSYHTQGDDFGGCVEAITLDKSAVTATLNNYMESEESVRDFNHVYLDTKTNTIYAAGGDYNKGAILMAVGLASDGTFSEGSGDADELTVIRLLDGHTDRNLPDGKYARDGNCVVRNGDYFNVASTGGFEALQINGDEYTRYADDLKLTDSKGKFVAIDKNNSSKMVTLNLANDDGETADVEINLYNTSDVFMENELINTITVSGVAPVDGKNVCQLDGNYIYACLGEAGMQIFNSSTGSLVLTFKPNGYSDSRVNGMDYDDDYLYLACGSAGLYVLSKAAIAAGKTERADIVVDKYTQLGLSAGHNLDDDAAVKSANYVSVDSDKYIYVAWGRDGLQIFRLVEP